MTEGISVDTLPSNMLQKHRHATYYIQINDRQFHLNIDEFGNYALLKFRGGEIYSNCLDSIKAMIEELTTFLEIEFPDV